MKIKLLKKLRKRAKRRIKLKYISETAYMIRAHIYTNEHPIFGEYRYYGSYELYKESPFYFYDTTSNSIEMYNRACKAFILYELKHLLAIHKTNKFKEQIKNK